MLFFKVSTDSCHKIKEILEEFKQMSSLSFNPSKSVMFSNKNAPRKFRKIMDGMLGIKIQQKIGK